jgi:hypothetical protein
MPCAYSWEIENNQKNGWEAFEPAVDTHTEQEPELSMSLEDQYVAKFGKKPHHKMKRETIEAALKE